MKCKYCGIECPETTEYGVERKCAFDDQGDFCSDNWDCLIMNALCDKIVATHPVIDGEVGIASLSGTYVALRWGKSQERIEDFCVNCEGNIFDGDVWFAFAFIDSEIER